jgi:hypothetical protein
MFVVFSMALSAYPTALLWEISVRKRELMAARAMRSLSFAISDGVARGAYGLDVIVMLRQIPKVMIVFVPPLPQLPYMATICTRQGVGMRPATVSDFNIDPATRLFLIAVAREVRGRPKATLARHIRSFVPGVIAHGQPSQSRAPASVITQWIGVDAVR